MKITRRRVLYQKADQIECESHRGRPVILHQKKPSRCRAEAAFAIVNEIPCIDRDGLDEIGGDTDD